MTRLRQVLVVAALALATAGVVVVATDDGSVCDHLQRQLAELQAELPGRGLQAMSADEWAAAQAAAPEQSRLLHELRAHACR